LIVSTVYEPPIVARDRLDRATQLVFVKDGFSWLAAIFPAIWFLVKGLWLELILFLIGAAALTWGIEASGASSTLSGMLLLIVQIVIGFEAGAIQGAALERRGWQFVGTATGRDRDECERHFFDAWQPAEPTASASPGSGLAPENSVTSWTATAWRNVKDGVARGRRPTGAKA
jgi:hypothetical protein